MRTPRRIRQAMKYSLLLKDQPVYERDEDGNIIYEELPDGTQVPLITGDTKTSYAEPVTFYNSITGTLTEDELVAFGSEKVGNAKMTYRHGQYPFKTGTLIWKESEVEYVDGEIDEKSADYVVLGVMPEGQHFWKAILAGVVKNE